MEFRVTAISKGSGGNVRRLSQPVGVPLRACADPGFRSCLALPRATLSRPFGAGTSQDFAFGRLEPTLFVGARTMWHRFQPVFARRALARRDEAVGLIVALPYHYEIFGQHTRRRDRTKFSVGDAINKDLRGLVHARSKFFTLKRWLASAPKGRDKVARGEVRHERNPRIKRVPDGAPTGRDNLGPILHASEGKA